MTHVYQPHAGGFAYFTSGVINGAIGVGGTWTAYSTLTLPAYTLGGTVTSNGQSFSGTIANLGTVTTVDINGGTIDGVALGGASAVSLGTPSSGTLTNCSGLPVSTGIAGLGTGVATFLATPSSANLASAVTDETGSGALVFGTSPTIATPTISTSVDFPTDGGRILVRSNDLMHASRTLFQDRTANTGTVLGIIPSGTATASAQSCYGASDPDNAPVMQLIQSGSSSIIRITSFGTGAKGPLMFQTNGTTEAMRIDTAQNVGIGATSFGTSASKVLAIATGTAPTTGPADTVQFYSSDDAAGHTIPSFYCEGTNVIATGQADSASSVRVKMRINGTVVTLLAI